MAPDGVEDGDDDDDEDNCKCCCLLRTLLDIFRSGQVKVISQCCLRVKAEALIVFSLPAV